jgi:hypothetical protein
MESLVATLAGRTPFVLYCKPNTVEVVGFFSGMLHFFKLMILQKRICYFVFDGKNLLIPENESEIMRVSFESNQDLFFLRSKRPSMNWLKGF